MLAFLDVCFWNLGLRRRSPLLSPWIFGIPCLRVCLHLFLIVFFSVSLTIFSYVSIIEGEAVSDGMISFRVPDALHVFNVVVSSGIGKLP